MEATTEPAEPVPAEGEPELAQIDARIQAAILAAESSQQRPTPPAYTSSPTSSISPTSDQSLGASVPSTTTYQPASVYPAGVYPGAASFAPQPPAGLVPSQPSYYQFDPSYVQPVPFGYYSSPHMQPTYEYQQPPQLWATPSGAPAAPFPYRPAYVRQPSQDPYQIYDEEGNALATYMPPAPQPQMQPAFAQAAPVYSQGFYPSGSVTPTPFNLSRTTTTTTTSSSGGRHSRGFSGFSSSESLHSSEPNFSSSNGRSTSNQRNQASQNGNFSPPKTAGPTNRSAHDQQQPQQPPSTMRTPRVKQAASDTLPRPPSHSDFALWVGNVPSDATHAELWTFFSNRPAPPPSTDGINDTEANGTGVRSIHLIARTNCCFVNYVSQRHLDFSLSINHGVSLRPHDPRAKELVCRVRKKEDSSRSGVGAQRSTGIHKSWVWEHEQQRKAQERVEQARINTIEYAANKAAHALDQSTRSPSSEGSDIAAPRSAQKSTSTDRSTNSTSSSFLARYFAKRYFILKSHNVQDLDESSRSGFWCTQAHNQPVLDKAYATAREGVFLFFSANGSGEFYGTARMNGPIAKPSTTSTMNLHPDSASSPRPQQPANSEMNSTISPRHLVDASPQPVDTQRVSAREGYLRAARETLRQQRHNHSEPLPAPSEEEETIAERRGASLDTGRLADGIRDLSMQESSPGALAEVGAETDAGHRASVASVPSSADSMFHREFIQSPQERNARLESLDDKTDARTARAPSQPNAQMLSRAFAVEWLSTERVPFSKTRNLRNAFNKMKDVKISRDGTELDPVAGEALLSLFSNKSSPRPSAS